MDDNVLELINPQSKSLAFKVHTFENDEYFNSLQKYNYFSVLLILAGKGNVIVDTSAYDFNDKTKSLVNFITRLLL